MTSLPDADALAAPACPWCHEPVVAGDLFCEACGHELPAADAPAGTAAGSPEPASVPVTCASCGAEGQASADGYCGVCGTKLPAPHDHEELVVDGAAAVTDRGRHHSRNEDAVALARGDDGRLAVVVCDGVSTTVDPDKASAAACAAALEVLLAADLDALGDPVADALVAAHAAAREAVDGLAFTPDDSLGTPSCTFLAAVVTPPGSVDVAGLGDCRAYLVDPATGDETMLTADDSWASEQIASGAMAPAVAYADPRAHTLTRWIGLDADPAWRPTPTHLDVEGKGRLVLCSDGLWNYTLEPGRLAEAGGDGDGDGDSHSLLAVARRLVRFANDRGGHDNVTVVAVDLPLPLPETLPDT